VIANGRIAVVYRNYASRCLAALLADERGFVLIHPQFERIIYYWIKVFGHFLYSLSFTATSESPARRLYRATVLSYS
jgi:hypothetical protein